jgi:protocatechuate 3,4-dioxygenase, alpha subunit
MTTTLGLTPTQTVGPFFLECLLREDMRRNVLRRPETEGVPIRIEGHLYDGDHAPVPDGLIEIWQADAGGRYPDGASAGRLESLDIGFVGYGRSGTDETGLFWFETIKPGAVPFDQHTTPSVMQSPHIGVMIHARGLLNHLVTRLYFADEPANLADPVLLRVPESRRSTLLARLEPGTVPALYRFDIILQGVGETAFFRL